MNDFEEYIRQGEPQKKEKGYAWQTAIGLQAVDDLKPSEYLIQTARQHIEGDITIEEAKQLIDSYYQSKTVRANIEDRTEEADKVSARIAEILSEKTFTFSPVEYITIHRRLFQGIYKFAGKIRDYNGCYSEYRISEDEKIKNLTKLKPKPQEAVVAENKKAEVSNKRKLSFKEKFELETVEKQLANLEMEKAELTTRLSSGSGSHTDLIDWSQRMEVIIKEIDEKSIRWLELSEIAG